jgi:thiol-disulfide isomerase/thioredoxin
VIGTARIIPVEGISCKLQNGLSMMKASPLLLTTLVLAGASFAEVPKAPLKPGDRVPDFSITDLGGKTRKLSELQKSTPSGAVTLTFWCSFCHSCRHMESRLDQLAQAYKGKAAVVAVDASAGETADRVRTFAKGKGLSVPILLDADGKSADLFGVGVTTTTVVIDGKGVLRYRGQFTDRQRPFAEEALKAVLAGNEVPQKETALQG